MIEIRLGYDNCQYGGSAQWCTFYITDDFQKFYDHDGNKYYENTLAPVIYEPRVQELREEFLKEFKNLNTLDSLRNVRGVIYLTEYENLNY